MVTEAWIELSGPVQRTKRRWLFWKRTSWVQVVSDRQPVHLCPEGPLLVNAEPVIWRGKPTDPTVQWDSVAAFDAEKGGRLLFEGPMMGTRVGGCDFRIDPGDAWLRT